MFKGNYSADLVTPSKPINGCPNSTLDNAYTCFCEDHCSWDACRLKIPPQNCLSSFDKSVAWAWNSKDMYWVAQGQIELSNFVYFS